MHLLEMSCLGIQMFSSSLIINYYSVMCFLKVLDLSCPASGTNAEQPRKATAKVFWTSGLHNYPGLGILYSEIYFSDY